MKFFPDLNVIDKISHTITTRTINQHDDTNHDHSLPIICLFVYFLLCLRVQQHDTNAYFFWPLLMYVQYSTDLLLRIHDNLLLLLLSLLLPIQIQVDMKNTGMLSSPLIQASIWWHTRVMDNVHLIFLIFIEEYYRLLHR